MTSHLLYQTLHPLYLCHHNRSIDITPTFEWHHPHLLCNIICTIYNMTSNPYFITVLYLWHQNLYMWNHIQYVGQHIHYTWDIIATICVLTPTVEATSHPLFVWHNTRHIKVASFALYKSSHPHFMTSDHRVYVITPTIFVIRSTVSVSSHPLYGWYHTKCINEITSTIIHDIISILYDMTATVWHHNHCIHDIRFPTYDITSRVYDILSPIPVTWQTLCLWIHVKYI